MDIKYNEFSVFWTNPFKIQLHNILFYLDFSLQNPIASRELYHKIIASLENLKILPRLYQKITSKRYFNKEIRRLVVSNYVIIYEVDDKSHKVNLLHIFHSSQDYLHLL